LMLRPNPPCANTPVVIVQSAKTENTMLRYI